MSSFRRIAPWVGLPGGVTCIILAPLLVLRGLAGGESWTSSTETDTVVGFLLFAVGIVSLWLSTRYVPRRASRTPVRSTDDTTSEEGMKRLREAFGSSWPDPSRKESAGRAVER